MIDVTLLGIGGTAPMPGRYLQSAYIQYDEYQILIDCGEATQMAIRDAGLQIPAIDVILLTHMHGDHTLGIPGLVQQMALNDRTKPLTIVGNSQTLRYVQRLLGLAPVKFKINLVENNKMLRLKELNIGQFSLMHSVKTEGYVLELNRLPKFDKDKAQQNGINVKYWNKLQHGEICIDQETGRTLTPDMVLSGARKGIKIVYATDTIMCNNLVQNELKNPDLLIIEGMYINDSDKDKAIKKRHMMIQESVKVADMLKANRTLITHIATQVPDVKIIGNYVREYSHKKYGVDSKIEVVNPGTKIQIDFKD